MNKNTNIGMQPVVSVSYGELVLKGKNRGMFVAAIKRHLHRALQGIPVIEEFEQFGKLLFAKRMWQKPLPLVSASSVCCM